MEDLEGAYNDALNAEGSALKENEAYLDSIQGRIDLFNNSVQTMWMNFIDSEVVQTIVDIGTFLIKLVDNIGLIETALAGVLAYLTIIKKQDLSQLFGGLLGGKKNKINLLKGSDLDDEIEQFNSALAGGAEAFGEYKVKAKEAGNGMDILATKLEQGTIKTKDGKVTAEDYTVALQSQSKAATKAANAEKMKSVAIGLSVMAISGIISAIQSYVDSIKTLEERYEELQSNISTIESDINSLDSELESIEEQIDTLSNKNLTITEAEELRKLKEQSAELQKQKELRENTLSVYNKQNEITSIEMFNQKLKETAAGQEKAKETAGAWAKVLGTIADVALVIGGIAVTGASFGGATALGATMVGAGMSGAATSLAGAAANKWGGNSKSVGEDLTAWYDSYVDAIAQADREAAEAESKYLSDISDANYDAWQKKLDAANTLKEELYNNLEEMRGYVSNLEYNDVTKSTIDGFNKLVAQINVKSLDGDIDAQISSIESLKSEFYQLSKGVDESGKNVALSAEEYARYCSIVEQILAYTPGLIQGYDAEGNAILGAADAQYTYNQLIEKSIELLKEQRRQAAEDAVTPDKIIESWKNAKNTSQSYIQSSDDKYIPGYGVYDSDMVNYWTSTDSENVVESIIGKKRGFWDSLFGTSQGFIKENIDAISKNRDLIEQEITSQMSSLGITQDQTDAYIEEYMNAIDYYITQYNSAQKTAEQELKSQLYVVPQSSTYYDDLSGSQVAFVNSYIQGLDGLLDMSEDDIKSVRENILNLTELIGENEFAQGLIDDLFALDPSKMPVQKYKDSINEVFAQLIDDNIITDDQKATIYNQLFPDMDDIDTMQEKVAAKLQTSSQGLIQNLTLPELKIAYKYLLEEADGSLSFEEMRQKIAEYSDELDGPIVETYSSLKQQITDFNDILLQSSEIISDNTKVSQEYKDALVELGISEEELAECFDDTNGLVVTNAKRLQELTAKAGSNTAQNIQLAKSQARLQYYELFKEMQGYISAQGVVVQGKQNEILALYGEMNALEKVISKYETLEAQLLGTTNAYEKFQKAQTVDSETNYISQTEEMLLALGQAFNTGELGTESAQAAIAALVPKSVYEDFDSVDDKMAAIYDYFKNGKLSEYFDITFDDDGNIESAEMKLGNLRKFIEDGLADEGANVFDGTDWQHFEFSDEFLTQLEELPDGADKLQYFADKMGVTKDVAFAFIKALEDHDIEWLNGDYSTMFEDLIPETLEGNIFGAMEKIAELNTKLASGEIDAKEYTTQIQLLNSELSKAKEASRTNMFGEDGVNDKTPSEIDAMEIDDVDNYFDANQKVINATDDLKEATNQYDEAVRALAKASEEGREATEEEQKAVEEAEAAVSDAEDTLEKAIRKKNEFAEPTEAEIEIALDDIETEIAQIGTKFDEELSKYFETDENGYWVVKTGMQAKLEKDPNYDEIINFVNLLNSQTTLTATGDTESLDITLADVKTQIDEIVGLLEAMQINLDPTSVTEFSRQLGELCKPQNIPVYLGAFWEGITGGESGAQNVNGTAHASGTAHKSGNWGLPQSEHDSLVGELGPEMVVDPHSGRYYTVGDNGAEMVDLPKGAIIFNHKQTEGLLKNGYVTSRGKAYASGNAHVTIFPDASTPTQWEGTGYDGPDDLTWDAAEALSDAASDISGAANDLSDTSNEFKETFDWIEVRIEELDETLGLLSAQLENAVYYNGKNDIIDKMIDINKQKYADSLSGAEYYENKANEYWSKIPAQYQEWAKNGAIAVTDFAGDANEAVVEAIQNYRDFIQKSADLTRQAEETITEIRDLAIQRIDNARESGEVRAAVEDSQTEKLQNRIDLIEEQGNIAGEAYYHAMMENSNKKIEYWGDAKEAMQAEFDAAVRNGEIIRGSNEWYEMVNQLYEIDAEIAEATIELEEFQNAINDIYWDNFENLTNQTGYLKDQTQSLIDLMEKSGDLVVEPDKKKYDGGTVEYWTADDVKWTDEGLASLGLYAQQMEIAEFEARQYAEAIDDLNEAYADGRYSESEYLEKLDELTSAQYDAIDSYYEAEQAIVDLNEARVDMIKEGIEKEIDAYEELIDKQKELLDAEKDLHDFEKSVMEQQKDIADIERRLASLANDNSMAAAAERKKLEAELAEAQYELQETYYDRSVEDKQNALDRELEDFKTEKDRELTKWEEYLDNVELVVADSLNTIQTNASSIYDTLSSKADEYNLTLSDAIMSPWKDGKLAVSDYQDKFDTAMSFTMDQLTALKDKWRDVIEEMARASEVDVGNINQENEDYADEQPREERPVYGNPLLQAPNSGTSSNNESQEVQPSLTKGSYVEVKPGTKWYENSAGGGAWGYARSGTIKYVNESGSHAYNIEGAGWIKKTDIVGYAKGTVSAPKSGIVNIDELGEELVLRAQNGRLTYMEKGSGVVPADLTSNLMEWGKLDPTSMIEDNRPSIAAPVVQNKEVNIDLTYGDILHIEEFHGDDPDEIAKIVAKQFEKHTKSLNNAIRKFAR